MKRHKTVRVQQIQKNKKKELGLSHNNKIDPNKTLPLPPQGCVLSIANYYYCFAKNKRSKELLIRIAIVFIFGYI